MQKTISLLRALHSLILVVALTASAPAIADSTSVRYYEDAVTRFNAGDLQGAQIQLKNSLQRNPGQLSARILMGRIQLQLGNPLQAEEQLLQANKLGADPTLTALALARARNRLGKYEDNIQAIIPTRLPLPQRPDLWVELGIARLHNEDPAGATLAFEEALKIQPGHPGGTLGLARVPLHTGDYAEAERLVEVAIDNAPYDAEAWFVKGSVLHSQGKNLAAASAYTRSKLLDPGHSSAVLGEATALLDAGQAADAAALFQALRGSHPWMPEAPYLQSKALRLLGRSEEAAAALRAAADILDPIAPADIAYNPPLLMLVGLISTESGQLERAYQAVSLYLDKRSDDLEARKLLARIALRMKKPIYARRALIPLVAAGQADAETFGLLGDANVQQNSYAAAERNYREAITKHQGGAEMVGRLGIAQYRQGRRELGLRTLQQLVDQTPEGAATGMSLYLGMLYFAEGRLEEARAIADAQVEAQPQNLLALNLQAALAIASGDRNGGYRMLVDLLDKAPDFRPARYNLAKLYILQGKYREAEEILVGFLSADPNNKRALQELARLAVAKGEPGIAIHHYERIRQLDGRALLPIIELIDLYLQTGRASDANQVVLALNRELPDNFLVHDAMARVQLALGEVADARNTLKSAEQLAAFDPELLLRTARMQVASGAYEDATKTLQRLLGEQSDSLSARKELAGVLFRRGRYDEARSEVQKVLDSSANDLFALALLGDIHLAIQQPAAAVDAYRQALRRGDRPELVVSLYRARALAGQGDAALGELQTWHQRHPDDPLVTRVLAENFQRQGDTDNALRLYERLLDKAPADTVALNNLAVLLTDVDIERALRFARRAYELDPHNPGILDTYGWILVQLGELEKGLAHLRESVARNGKSATLRYHLAVALQEYGSLGEAQRELRAALALEPEFEYHQDARRRLDHLNER